MDIKKNWKIIRRHVTASFKTSLHVSIATVSKDNTPLVTSIGTLFLNKDQTGFYFEKFSSKLTSNVEVNNQVCVLAVNSSRWFWIKSLYKNKFEKHPALKLYGELGLQRKASDQELSRLERRMKLLKGLKGHTYLWGKGMDTVREIRFNKVEKMKLGIMTAEL
ncbi:Pyridoxamine 5'-phosphate oxidase family protein [Tenacibaculum sp. 190130A14a]|uniref:Pyridoxamine 5'-phosphate oxidase family protein n=1 Tax=Tenacibaculum polynesiense TaxID=3137857 RepID=A0ABM9P7M9_9FLAO